MEEKIKKILSTAYFIGGSPCSGKSTITEILADRYNLTYYKIDDYERKHIEKAEPEKYPIMYKWSQMDWEEIWMRPVDIQVKEELKFYRERFEMILNELVQFSIEDKVIMEGAALLPELINDLGIKKNKVVYIIPSKKFQIEHYSKRNFIKDILSECNNPEKAFKNWMERDHQFGKVVKTQAKKLGFKVIDVDGTNSIEENTKLVTENFNLE